MNKFVGTGVALVTPFNVDGSVDYSGLKKLVRYQIENGINYLVILGTTGEPPTLSKDEIEKVKATVVKENNGKLPLVLGMSSNNTQALIESLQTTDLSDFDAILSVSPYYNKPTQEGIYQHFKAVSENSSKPIIVYNVPSRTGGNILPKTIVRLANDFKNIIGVKEAAGDMIQALRIVQNSPKEFLMISGDDMIALPMTLAGGAGVISVLGQALPSEFSKMIQFGLQGNSKAAYELHYKMMDSIDLIFEEGNPAGIKTMLSKLNICSNFVRLPLVKASTDLTSRINKFIDNF